MGIGQESRAVRAQQRVQYSRGGIEFAPITAGTARRWRSTQLAHSILGAAPHPCEPINQLHAAGPPMWLITKEKGKPLMALGSQEEAFPSIGLDS